MTVSPTIVREPAANRRWRWLAPLLVALGLAVLIMTPGFLVQLSGNQDARPITQGTLPHEGLATPAS